MPCVRAGRWGCSRVPQPSVTEHSLPLLRSHPFPCSGIHYNWIITIVFCPVPCGTGCFAGMFYPYFFPFSLFEQPPCSNPGPSSASVPLQGSAVRVASAEGSHRNVTTLGFFSRILSLSARAEPRPPHGPLLSSPPLLSPGSPGSLCPLPWELSAPGSPHICMYIYKLHIPLALLQLCLHCQPSPFPGNNSTPNSHAAHAGGMG